MISANSTGVATLLPCALMPQQQWELSEKSVHYLYVHPIWSFSTHDSVPLMYKYSFFPQVLKSIFLFRPVMKESAESTPTPSLILYSYDKLFLEEMQMLAAKNLTTKNEIRDAL